MILFNNAQIRGKEAAKVVVQRLIEISDLGPLIDELFPEATPFERRGILYQVDQIRKYQLYFMIRKNRAKSSIKQNQEAMDNGQRIDDLDKRGFKGTRPIDQALYNEKALSRKIAKENEGKRRATDLSPTDTEGKLDLETIYEKEQE